MARKRIKTPFNSKQAAAIRRMRLRKAGKLASAVTPSLSKIKDKKRGISKRARGVSRLAGAAGIRDVKVGAGRPTGTYKYGMPIQQWKKLQSKRRAQKKLAYQQTVDRLGRRGISPQHAQVLQQQRMARMTPEQQAQQRGIADDEVDFQEDLAKNTISPNTQSLLDRLRRTQLKGKRDNINQQRVHQERRMLSKAGNLMNAHKNMIDTQMDFTGVSSNNILSAPNTFKENSEDNILRTKRLNILQTREAGNTVGF